MMKSHLVLIVISLLSDHFYVDANERIVRKNRSDPIITKPAPGTRGVSKQKENRGGIPMRFGTISRDEWLAKEYFGYLCGKSFY